MTNARFLLRIALAAVFLAAVGFGCGYFGPFWFRHEVGIGPITGLFAAPVGAFIGTIYAIIGSVKGYPGSKYFGILVALAATFAAGILILVRWQ